jgi:hypothetical protein
MDKHLLKDKARTVILDIQVGFLSVVSVLIVGRSVVEGVDGEGTPLEEYCLEPLHEQVEDVANVEARIL